MGKWKFYFINKKGQRLFKGAEYKDMEKIPNIVNKDHMHCQLQNEENYHLYTLITQKVRVRISPYQLKKDRKPKYKV